MAPRNDGKKVPAWLRKTCIITSRRAATASSTIPSMPSSPHVRSAGFPPAMPRATSIWRPTAFSTGSITTRRSSDFPRPHGRDSVGNIQETGEFVWNLATMDLAQQMNATAAHVAHHVSEFNISGLTAVPSKLVNVPRVAESPVSFECNCRKSFSCRAPMARRCRPGSPSARSLPSTSTRPSSRTAFSGTRWPTRSCAPAARAIISKSGRTPCSR